MSSRATVYLVGAGPGDAGLMTLRGAELLARAEVVVYDALVNADLLRLAPKTAEFIYAGKRSRDHAIPQEELNQLLIEKAKAGKCVVRLKGGDPYVFGRGGEEATQLVAAGVSMEVVPGISSVVAVPNYAGIPITHRNHCSAFTVITGHEDPNKDDSRLDWKALAQTPGTKIILMGAERIGRIAKQLIDNGMPASTPAAMVRMGTTGEQRSVDGTLENIAERAVSAGVSSPAVTVIGEVVNLRSQLNWFEHRPLFGKRIVVTRTREQASQLSKQLLELGADVLEVPTVKIGPPTNGEDLKDAILELNSYDWIVFTSPNGVDNFFKYFFAAFDDLRDIGGVRIAAVGPATAEKLKQLHLKVDVMPNKYVTVEIAGALSAFESIENLKILLLRAEVANPELPGALEALGGIVDDVAVYKTEPETEDVNGAAARLLEGGADWITFTSGSTVENFHARFNLGEMLSKFPRMKLASIGPETTKAIKALGFAPTIEARDHTIPGLVKALRSEIGK